MTHFLYFIRPLSFFSALNLSPHIGSSLQCEVTTKLPFSCSRTVMAPTGWEIGMGSAAASGGPMHDTQTYLYQRMDDVLDFSDHKEFFPSSSSGVDSHGVLLPPPEPSAPFAMNSSSPSNHFSFSNDLYIPYCEEEAELEWLSRFVDDSFSDVPYHHVPPVSSSTEQQRERSTPAPPSLSSPSTTSTSSSSSELAMAEDKAGNAEKSSGSGRGLGGKKGGAGVGVRRCTHCASEKTPQWRTGPMGPKTLCNACGVRYKSGRLVPEYRPAASPTFVLTQHSNSHRKVLELRRQKELMLAAATATGALPEFLLP